MPRRYGYRRRRGGWAKTARVLAGGKKFGKAFVKHAAAPIMATLAKRFIKTYTSTGVTSAAVNKILISEIPRNITGTDPQQENRVGRKIWIKGVTVNLRMESTISSAPQSVRILLVRQDDPAENLAITTIYAPVGATSGQKVLYDRTFRLDTAAAGQANDGRVIKKWIPVNRKLLFTGDQLNGTDADEGSLVLYKMTDDTVGFTFRGATTVHYRELL